MTERVIPRFQSDEHRANELNRGEQAALWRHGADAERFFDLYTIRDLETGKLTWNPDNPITPEVAREFAPHVQALYEAECYMLDIQGVHPLEDPSRIRTEISTFAVALALHAE